jgi:hypothetical protein
MAGGRRVEVQRLLGDEVLPTEPHQTTLSEVFL